MLSKNLLLWKFYFDKGYSILTYFKYPFLLILGADTLSSGGNNKLLIIISSIGYFLLCFSLGLIWAKKLQEQENEIANSFNPFVKKMTDFTEKTEFKLSQPPVQLNYKPNN